MSSTAFNRLRGLFSKSTSPTITTIKSNLAAEIRAPISSKDKKISSFVEKFKKYTANPRFRRYNRYYEATVLRLAREEHFSAIRDILEHQKKYSEIKDEKFAVRLICLYGKAKMVDDAQRLFDELPSLNCERTVVSFNALLAACVNSKNFNRVFELFKELPDELSIEPDIVSYNTVIKALCDVGSLDSAIIVMNEMESNNIQPDVVTFNTILDAFYKTNRIEEAEKLWFLMEKKNVLANVRTYNSRLRGLVTDNRVSDAAEWIEKMRQKGVKPDNYSFNALMKGFVDVGNLKEAKVWYKKMMGSECRPDKATFGMLIPFACDKDDFDYAFELCNDALKAKQSVYNSAVQRVVDGLVERSKNSEAQKLMKMAKLK